MLSRYDAFNDLRNRLRVGLLLPFRFKILLVLFYNEISETIEGRSEEIEDFRCAEAVSRRVV